MEMILSILFVLAASIEDGVPTSAEGVHPLLTGVQAPDALLHRITGESVQLKGILAERPTVLIFYRGGWCPYCSRQLAGLQEIAPKLQELGYQIVAVSPDKPEKLRASLDKEKLTYTLLSDSKMDAARAFGIAFKVDDTTLDTYKTYGIDLTEASGETHHLLPVPSVFILGTDGVIRFEYVNPNYKVRLDPDVLLAAAKAALREK